jgi:hypothetical protein
MDATGRRPTMTQKAESTEDAGRRRSTPLAGAPLFPTSSRHESESTSRAPTAPSGKLSAVRIAVRQFLSTELDAREIRIIRLTPSDRESTGWFAEAEILVPNLEVRMLGLPLTQEVLEREHYVLEIEPDLTVRSYEHAKPQEV